MNTSKIENRLLSDDQVEARTSLSRTTRWRMERDSTFPKRVVISRNRVGWLASEINQWIADRVAAREQD